MQFQILDCDRPADGPRRRVLLVSCYDLGRSPTAIASPAAVLREAGIVTETLDLALEPLDLEKVGRARLVAISVPMHTALRLGVEAGRRIREVAPGIHIAYYGLYAVLNERYLREAALADTILGGEFEAELLELAERLLAGIRAESALVVAETSTPRKRRPPRRIASVPDRGSLPGLERYARLDRGGALSVVGTVEATRGCKHLCRHCPIPPVYQGRFFAVGVPVVLEDVRRQVAAGARHITFADPDFLNGPTHARRVARAVHAQFPELTFDFTAKIEHLVRHRTLLPEFRRLGCLFVISAVESLSTVVLERLAKGHARADVEVALAACRKVGIHLRPTWVPFTPWSTLADYAEFLEFVAANHLIDSIDPVQYTIRLLIPPGSLLLEDPELTPRLGPLDPAALSYRWTHVDPRMDELARRVAAVVEALLAAGTGAFEVFDAVVSETRAFAGPVRVARPERPAVPAPRMTESWFC